MLIVNVSFLSSCATDLTAGQDRMCEVHHVAMQRTLVYGISPTFCMAICYPPEYYAARKAFPHALDVAQALKTPIGPNCVPEYLYLCPKCEAASQRWQEHFSKRRTTDR